MWCWYCFITKSICNDIRIILSSIQISLRSGVSWCLVAALVHLVDLGKEKIVICEFRNGD